VQRSLVGSALYSDVNGLARRSLSGTGGGLVGAARRLLLTGSDTLGDLVDAARYLLLTGSDTLGVLVDASRYLLVTGGDPVGDLVDATHYVVVTRDDPIDALLIERRGGWRGQGGHAGSILRR